LISPPAADRFDRDRDPGRYAGLDLLTSAVIILDETGRVAFANAAAETLLDFSLRTTRGQRLSSLLVNGSLIDELFADARRLEYSNKRLDFQLHRPGREAVQVHGIVTVLHDEPQTPVLFEMQETDQQRRMDREERIHDQTQINRELIRNLAHEIKNPLGGIRGAAQLLQMEVSTPAFGAEMSEYTQVIIKEADRLQSLVDRLLAPHRRARIVGDVNIHEVCERVRSVMMAEYSRGLLIGRDYDASIPEFRGDKEQLIQALLNIAHNASQALTPRIARGDAEIVLRTRIVRQVTIARTRQRLALELHVIDNGPGIDADIRDRVFLPLVSGREGGTGLGLTLAQTFVDEHHGTIDFESQPGRTDFRILLPLP
jgi:two-component system nitrogen regulation sensor histidine kinase GlnL